VRWSLDYETAETGFTARSASCGIPVSEILALKCLLAEAAKQYASNPKRMTIEQYDILRRFGGGERNYYKLSAEILLNLLEGAETHSQCHETARQSE